MSVRLVSERRSQVGHAEHFLTRLDRVSAAETDLALKLYNDVEMLREILARAGIPEDADRVAISLDDPVKGPFILVTRGGRFVTCLGRGMKTRSLPIVTRAQLDRFSREMKDLRKVLEVTRSLPASSEGPAMVLARSIRSKAMAVPREEFVAFSAWIPFVRPVLLVDAITVALEMPKMRKDLADCPRINAHQKKASLGLHAGIWCACHSLMLLSTRMRETIAALEEASEGNSGPCLTAFGMTSADSGISGLMLRSWHWAARMGKECFSEYKKSYLGSYQPLEMIHWMGALVCMGLRTRALLPKVQKALSFHPSEEADWDGYDDQGKRISDQQRRSLAFVIGLCRAAAKVAFETPEVAREKHLALGRALVFEKTSRLRGRHPLRHSRLEQVPEDWAFAITCSQSWDVSETERLRQLLTMLPWVARAKPEDFYLPKEALSVLELDHDLKHVVEWASAENARRRAFSSEVRIPAPRASETRRQLGPNEFCACGSGKKFKRCCSIAKAS